MQWAPTWLARLRAVALALVALVLGVVLFPGTARAQAAGYCSELALSDVAPAPMIPAGPDALAPGDCPSHPSTQAGNQSPWRETPAPSRLDRVEPAWPDLMRWSLRQCSGRSQIEVAVVPIRPGHANGVFRPPR
jgi:hypothetical protein